MGCNQSQSDFKCADEDTIARTKGLKLYLPLSNIDYDADETRDALSWTLDNYRMIPIKP